MKTLFIIALKLNILEISSDYQYFGWDKCVTSNIYEQLYANEIDIYS